MENGYSQEKAEAESSVERKFLREDLETVTAPCCLARALCHLEEQLPGRGGTPHDARPVSCATVARRRDAWLGPACRCCPTTLRLDPTGLVVPIVGPGATVGPVRTGVCTAHSLQASPAGNFGRTAED